MLPKGTPGMCTILYHSDGSVTNVDVPVIQPQRVATKPTADATDNVPEPNYVSDDEDDEDDAQTTRRRRSPRLSKLADAEHPDVAGNTPHRILALAAAETAEIPRLTIQQHKLAKRYGAANLELQLREWGYKTHSDWTEANNFAGAIVCPNIGKMLEYRDLINVPELRQTWMASLANELGRLAQGIRRWHSGMCLTFHMEMESHGFKYQPAASQEGSPGRKCPDGDLLECYPQGYYVRVPQ